MKHNLYLLIFLLISCGFNSVTQEQIFLSEIAGNYTGCRVYPGNTEFYEKYEVNINGEDLKIKRILTQRYDDTCSTSVLIINKRYKIINISDEDSSKMNLDLEVQSIYYTADSAWQVNQNWCGIIDWVKGESRDITGLSCPNLLSVDPFHSNIREKFSPEYIQITKKNGTLSIPADSFSESGDSPEERIISDQIYLESF